MKIINHRNTAIIISLLLLIFINSSYVLWQIDRHEKALIGQEWLNAVPYNEWTSYEQKKSAYEKIYRFYRENNTELVAIIHDINNKNLNATKNTKGLTALIESINNSIPEYGIREFALSKLSQEELKSQHPDEYKTWQAIVYDLNLKKPPNEPRPSNPSKQVIQQQINSYNRYLICSDSFLGLSLIVFLVVYYKGK